MTRIKGKEAINLRVSRNEGGLEGRFLGGTGGRRGKRKNDAILF